MPSPLFAIAKGKGPLRAAFEIILKDALAPEDQSDQEVVGIVAPVEVAGQDWADLASDILRRHPHCVGLVIALPRNISLFEQLRPRLEGVLKLGLIAVRVQRNPARSLLGALLNGARRLMLKPASQTVMHSVRETVFAASLYRAIQRFGHGATKDLTNQVLAPLRILLLAGVSPSTLERNWKGEALKLLKEFRGTVIASCRADWWLSNELKDGFKQLPVRSGQFWDVTLVPQLERVMDLLTECRVLAGAMPQSSKQSPDPELPLTGAPADQSWCYEVLVIDDHAGRWRPVFAELQSRFARGVNCESIPITFVFITGGKDSDGKADSVARILARFPDYDAVLLDVFLNDALDGIEILTRMRRHSVNLPVIIWTSSRAPELPAEAQLAHGFLFKKTATLDSMMVLLAERIREGNAKRRYSIPGHFFDQSIRDRVRRKTALRFAEYGAKQLDSFHALDEGFFRFFTDHGGRHLIKLLEYLEALLKPLIRDRKVFSSADSEREEEILALYLAVFLHEFGMLRLRGRDEPSEESVKESKLARSLHALRGLSMLNDPTGSHWPDEEGQYQAGKRFFSETDDRTLVSSVALITGYHSRLLPIDRRSFGNWTDKARQSAGEKIARDFECWRPGQRKESCKEGLSRISDRFFSEKGIEAALNSCRTSIADKRRFERLRHHCALFRFADAIDVDHTRNPADFLALSAKVNPADLREALKRQVVRGVRAEGGKIIFFACVPAPEITLLSGILGGMGSENVESVWGGDWTLTRIKRLSGYQKKLDAVLKGFWTSPLASGKRLGFNFTKKGALGFKSKIAVASLTALSVAWEIADEYEAILKTNLNHAIKLHEFRWRKKCPVGKRKNMLTMLFHPDALDRLCQDTRK